MFGRGIFDGGEVWWLLSWRYLFCEGVAEAFFGDGRKFGVRWWRGFLGLGSGRGPGESCGGSLGGVHVEM